MSTNRLGFLSCRHPPAAGRLPEVEGLGDSTRTAVARSHGADHRLAARLRLYHSARSVAAANEATPQMRPPPCSKASITTSAGKAIGAHYLLLLRRLHAGRLMRLRAGNTSMRHRWILHSGSVERPGSVAPGASSGRPVRGNGEAPSVPWRREIISPRQCGLGSSTTHDTGSARWRTHCRARWISLRHGTLGGLASPADRAARACTRCNRTQVLQPIRSAESRRWRHRGIAGTKPHQPAGVQPPPAATIVGPIAFQPMS